MTRAKRRALSVLGSCGLLLAVGSAASVGGGADANADAVVDDAPIAAGANDRLAYLAEAEAQGSAIPVPTVTVPDLQPMAEGASAWIQARAADVREAAPKLKLNLSAVSPAPAAETPARAAFEPVEDRRLEARLELDDKTQPRRAEPKSGRIFAFAAVSGDAAGYMFRSRRDPTPARRTWAVEKIANIGDAQLGVAWRKGAMQASLALVDREISFQSFRKDERFLAFTFSVKPKKPKAAKRA